MFHKAVDNLLVQTLTSSLSFLSKEINCCRLEYTLQVPQTFQYKTYYATWRKIIKEHKYFKLILVPLQQKSLVFFNFFWINVNLDMCIKSTHSVRVSIVFSRNQSPCMFCFYINNYPEIKPFTSPCLYYRLFWCNPMLFEVQ